MSQKKSIRVCFIGGWRKGYSRTEVIRQGIIANGGSVSECYLEPTKWNPVRLLYLPLFSLAVIIRTIRLVASSWNQQCDAFYVPFPAYYDMPAVWIIGKLKGTPVLFDMLISKYVTYALDHTIVKKRSFKAALLRWYDRTAARLATVIITDTPDHGALFQKELGLDARSMVAIPVGSIASAEGIERKPHSDFRVVFYGSYLPLHGTDVILRAAKLLNNERVIKFIIIGDGPLAKQIQQLAQELRLDNVEFVNSFIDYPDLIEYLVNADLCLGIFGDSPKSDVVVPNKVFDAIALGKPIITAHSAALDSMGFQHLETLFACKKADPKSLANAILELKNNNELRRSIAEKGYALYKERFTQKKIGAQFLDIISR
ncbi:MAG: glycosyltransferase [Candidatus Kerfeldbacteria bacterium]